MASEKNCLATDRVIGEAMAIPAGGRVGRGDLAPIIAVVLPRFREQRVVAAGVET